MEILKEVTDWGEENVANGIYWVEQGTNLVAYQPPGGIKKVFKNPLKNFSKSRRKFIKLKDFE